MALSSKLSPLPPAPPIRPQSPAPPESKPDWTPAAMSPPNRVRIEYFPRGAINVNSCEERWIIPFSFGCMTIGNEASQWCCMAWDIERKRMVTLSMHRIKSWDDREAMSEQEMAVVFRAVPPKDSEPRPEPERPSGTRVSTRVVSPRSTR